LKGLWTKKPIAGELVINTAGAWADSIRREPLSPIYPNKGQILTLSMSEKVTLTYMIRTPRVYLVPKNDGSLRIGATSEEVGFDQKVTGGGILQLLQAAFEVVPGIAYMEFLEAEAKLRPTSLNRMPCIEETELKGYFRAVGHGRDGILLAPYTAYEMVRKVCKSE
jgi:glycine oxidase